MKLTQEYIHAIGEALRFCYKQDPTILVIDGKTEISYNEVYSEWNGKQILDDYEKARELDKWNTETNWKSFHKEATQNQKLRERLEKEIKDLERFLRELEQARKFGEESNTLPVSPIAGIIEKGQLVLLKKIKGM